MNKKSFLIKILPVLLIFVLVLTVILTVTSCDSSKNTPYGSLTDNEYAKISLADGDYSISEKELYDQLLYNSDIIVRNEISKIIFADEIALIEGDMASYTEKFKDLINDAAYNTTDQDIIDELTAEEKALALEKYYDTLYRSGVTDIDYEAEPYQEILYDYYMLKLAFNEFSTRSLVEAMNDVDDKENEYRVSNTVFQEKYDSLREYNDTVGALVVQFDSASDADECLKELHIKFVKEELYRVPSVIAEDYDDTYADFSLEGQSPLNEAEVLFEFVRLYNYVYAYRNAGVDGLVGTADDSPNYGVDAIAGTEDDIISSLFTIKDAAGIFDIDLSAGDGLADATVPLTVAQKNYINSLGIKSGDEEIASGLLDLIDELITQTTDPIAEFDANNKLLFEHDDINDSSISKKIYEDLSLSDNDKIMYTPESFTSGDGAFVAFKLKDYTSIKYNTLESLANYVKELDKGASADETKVAAYYNTLISEFSSDIIGLTSAETKTYLLDKAADLDIVNVIDYEWDQTEEDSVWTSIFNGFFTEKYIEEVTGEEILNANITIYDPLLELYFSIMDPDFKTSKSESPDGNAVVLVEIDDIKTYINVDGDNGLFSLLEKQSGPAIAFQIASKQSLKEEFYDSITEEELAEITEEFENSITSFKSNSFAQQNLPSSIGKENFIRYAYKSANEEDAIFNSGILTKLHDLLVIEDMDEFFPGIYDTFSDMAALSYNDYFNVTYSSLRFYTDDNEDGIGDDVLDYTPARKNAVENAIADLINDMYDIYRMPNYKASNGFQPLVDSYNDSGRVNDLMGIPIEGFQSEADRASFLWSEYKKLGIHIDYKETNNKTRSLSESAVLSDDILRDQIYNFYNYAKDMIDSGTFVDTFVSRIIVEDDLGTDLDVANSAELLSTDIGYYAFNFTDSELAPSSKFLTTDNPMDGDTKLYPYDIREDNPRPFIMDGETVILQEIISTEGGNQYLPTTLYNENDIPSANQINLYISERNSDLGVLSFESEVHSALTTFTEPLYGYYIDEDFDKFLMYNFLLSYDFTLTDATNQTEIVNQINISQKELFKYNETAVSTAWWAFFDLD